MSEGVLLFPGRNETAYPSLLLETRQHWQIPNEMRPELLSAVRDASVQQWREWRPNARLRSITGLYNCIGMVVASRRTWVDPEHLLRILREDGYRQLAGIEEVACGDMVVYRDRHGDVSHAGIVVGRQLYMGPNSGDVLIVLSKWGQEGEYEHAASDVPEYCGTPVEYWTDRKG